MEQTSVKMVYQKNLTALLFFPIHQKGYLCRLSSNSDEEKYFSDPNSTNIYISYAHRVRFSVWLRSDVELSINLDVYLPFWCQ